MPEILKLWTIREAGEALRLSPFSVRRHIGEGRLKAIRLPHGQLRISEEALREFIEDGDTRSGEALAPGVAGVAEEDESG